MDAYADGANVPAVNQRAVFVSDACRDTSTNVAAPDGNPRYRVLTRSRCRSSNATSGTSKRSGIERDAHYFPGTVLV